jgi:hypothetical protein
MPYLFTLKNHQNFPLLFKFIILMGKFPSLPNLHGFLGWLSNLHVVKSVVKKMMYFGDWNTREGYSKESCGMMDFSLGFALVF